MAGIEKENNIAITQFEKALVIAKNNLDKLFLFKEALDYGHLRFAQYLLSVNNAVRGFATLDYINRESSYYKEAQNSLALFQINYKPVKETSEDCRKRLCKALILVEDLFDENTDNKIKQTFLELMGSINFSQPLTWENIRAYNHDQFSAVKLELDLLRRTYREETLVNDVFSRNLDTDDAAPKSSYLMSEEWRKRSLSQNNNNLDEEEGPKCKRRG